MIVGFSAHGTGMAASAIAYLTDRVRGGVERDPPPTVLRGEPELTAALIDGSRFKHRYTSGVLSFAPGEEIALELQQAIMDRFEATAFAGLDPEQFSILWVRHDHAGHCELNFLIPRVELTTGRSLNIAPPGRAARELFDSFRTAINLEYGLADPDDPARAREVRVPAHVAKLRAAEIRAGRDGSDDPREVIAATIGHEVAGARINDRADVLAFLRNAGFEITREGKDYVSVRDLETNDKYRLKGPYFRAGFQREQLASEIAERSIDFGKPVGERLIECRARLERLTEARCSYNRRRYQSERSDSRMDLIGDLPQIARERAPEDRREREGLEAARLCDDGSGRTRGVLGDGGHRSSKYGWEQDCGPSTHSLADDDPSASRRIRGVGGRNGALSGDPERDLGQRNVGMSESVVSVYSRQEALAYDGTGASLAERLRALGAGLREAGERIARGISDFAAGLQRLFAEHDGAVREHNETLLVFDRASERFERAARAISERFERLTGALELGRAEDRTEDAELHLEIER